MASLALLDTIVVVNLVLSAAVVAVSIWGYRKIGKPTPLFIGFAYTLFAATHFFLLTGTADSSGPLFIALRTTGYILVIFGVFAIIREIIERKKAEAALRASEEHLSAVFDQAAVGIAEFLPDGRITRANRRFTGITGISGPDLATMTVSGLIATGEESSHFSQLMSVLRGENPQYSAEIPVPVRGGGEAWCQVFISAINDASGNPLFFILVLEDITARKLAEDELALLNENLERRVDERTEALILSNEALSGEVAQRTRAEAGLTAALHEKEVLLKEIHHRVKNNLQIVISLLYLQAKKTSDPASSAGLMDSQARVRSMALIHEKLYRAGDLASVDFDGYLSVLASELMVSYGIDRQRVDIRVDAKNLPLSIRSAIPLGLIMNELISNSLKYAFGSSRYGEIRITGAEEDGKMVIRFRDNGCGIPGTIDWRHTDSLGLNLVQMLVRQLKGTVDLLPANGTEFVFRIPVTDKR
ncbi:MAG TPA: histidine kinase dimerization/phosphoacceptor domain -containing protein [Methanoregula sp.]|nr:histidine kinase dimerization/phosphoacceptor domain -containing protein [Methanoregula sp.]